MGEHSTEEATEELDDDEVDPDDRYDGAVLCRFISTSHSRKPSTTSRTRSTARVVWVRDLNAQLRALRELAVRVIGETSSVTVMQLVLNSNCY